jgi:hypothetical protein
MMHKIQAWTQVQPVCKAQSGTNADTNQCARVQRVKGLTKNWMQLNNTQPQSLQEASPKSPIRGHAQATG